MVHAVIGGLFLTRALYKLTRLGKAVQKVKYVATGIQVDALTRKLKRLRHEADLGINRSEEAHHLKTHGTVEPIFPARIRETDLPAKFETVFQVRVVGEYLFKLSEWNDVWEWILQKALRQNGQPSRAEGRDGFWLLHIGRERWGDSELRVKAFKNAEKFAELWRKTEMWEQQDS